MTTNVDYYIEDIADVLAANPSPAYTHWRLYRDAANDPAGAFATQVGSDQLLIAEQELYTLEDATGDETRWYKAAFWSGAVESAKSPPWQSQAMNLRTLMIEAAEFAGRGFSSITTDNGAAVTGLIDAPLADEGESVKYLEGSWVYIHGAAAADQLRRVATDGFTPVSGTLKPSRAWSADAVVASGTPYHIYQMLPPHKAAGQPYSWAEAVRDAMWALKYEDELNLGEGTLLWKDEFDLSPWLEWIEEESVQGIWLRRDDSNGNFLWQDASKNGRYWEWRRNGVNSLGVRLRPPPLVTETIIVKVQRPYDKPFSDTDVVIIQNRDIAIRATALAAYQHMNAANDGRYAKEEAMMTAELRKLYRGPFVAVRGA